MYNYEERYLPRIAALAACVSEAMLEDDRRSLEKIKRRLVEMLDEIEKNETGG
jgi:hypothetical protein